jgi:hypothetical protein
MSSLAAAGTPPLKAATPHSGLNHRQKSTKFGNFRFFWIFF